MSTAQNAAPAAVAAASAAAGSPPGVQSLKISRTDVNNLGKTKMEMFGGVEKNATFLMRYVIVSP